MAAYKILAAALLATLVSCEPPVPYNYPAPSSSYGAPSQQYSAPSSSYGAPSQQYSAPSSSYGAPSQQYSAPSSSYGAPSQQYSAPSSSYGAPSQSYSAPSSEYDAPASGGSYDHGHGHGNGHDNEVPKSYEFGYSVKDAQSGNDYGRQESSDGNTVRGEYRVQLPDGRVQIVTYHADWQTGFHADVRYEGEAKYPEPAYKQSYSAPAQDSYNYNAPADHGDFSGSLTGFSGSGANYDGYKPSASYGTPHYH